MIDDLFIDEALCIDETLGLEAASAQLDLFARSYGPESTLLAAHAAVLEQIRPELLALLRKNFFSAGAKSQVRLDADVLFGPLCINLGNGYFKMDSEVRRQLLILLDAWGSRREEPEFRSKRVAQFIRHYVEWRRRKTFLDPIEKSYLNQIHWVALAFDEPNAAVHSLFQNMQPALADLESGSAQLRFGGVTKVLELPMAAFLDELNYARAVDALAEADNISSYDKALALVEDIQNQVFSSGGLSLPAPREVLDRFKSNLDFSSIVATKRTQKEVSVTSNEISSSGASLPYENKSSRRLGKNGREHTVLHLAVKIGDIAEVTRLLQQQPELLNAPGKYERSPMHLAAGYGHIDIVNVFVDAKAAIDLGDESCVRPLLLAAHWGHTKTVAILLRNGADANATNLSGTSAINVAAFNGHINIVQQLLEYSVDLDLQASKGFSPLAAAARAGRYKIFDILLSHSPNVYAEDESLGWCLLHSAATGGNIDIVRRLLSFDLEVDKLNKHGWTPLASAVYGGHAEIAELLIEVGANVNFLANDWPLVHLCSQQKHYDNFNITGNHVKTLECLQAYGSDINTALSTGFTPLHIAIHHRASGVVQTLLKMPGIEPNKLNQGGLTPLLYAASLGAEREAALLLQAPDIEVNCVAKSKNALMFALEHITLSADGPSDFPILEVLLADDRIDINFGSPPIIWKAADRAVKGKNYAEFLRLCEDPRIQLQWQNNQDESLLHHAAKNRQEQIVKILIEHQVAINVVDKVGETPLMKAVFSSHPGVVECLLKAGAEVNRFPINALSSPLQLAVDVNSAACISILIKYGADINECDPLGETLLHRAAENAKIDVTQTLLSLGLDSQARDINGMTPFLSAVRTGNIQVAQLYIDKKVNVSQFNRDGWSALHFASQRNCLDLVEALIKHSVKVNALSLHPVMTPLQAAAESGAEAVLEKLLAAGAGINISSVDRAPPIFLAIENGHYKAALRLLDLGVSRNTCHPISGVSLGVAVSTRIWQTRRSEEKPDPFEEKIRERIFATVNKVEDVFDSDEASAKFLAGDRSEEKIKSALIFSPLQKMDVKTIDDEIGEPWKTVIGKPRSDFLQSNALVSSEEPLQMERAHMAWCFLPFYETMMLIRVRDVGWANPRSALFYLAKSENETYRLEGTSPPIHSVNSAAPLQLNSRNIIEYLRFFCFFVRGDKGPFYLLETIDDPALNNIKDKSLLSALSKCLRPIEFTGMNDKGHYVLSSTLVFGESVSLANFEVEPTGMVTMIRDEIVLSSLKGLIDLPLN